jgi:hypothetical protein
METLEDLIYKLAQRTGTPDFYALSSSDCVAELTKWVSQIRPLLLEPFSDLILIDPQPEGVEEFQLTDSSEWFSDFGERFYAPSSNHHPVLIRNRWWWSL